MTMLAIVTGVLAAAPVRRNGQSGREFVTATVRVHAEGEPFLTSAICFDQNACAKLIGLRKGDQVAIGGRASLKAWEGRDGTEQHGVGLVVEQVMTPAQFGKRRKEASLPLASAEARVPGVGQA